jgi:multicomponent Na+:H+ antiporter subunit D
VTTVAALSLLVPLAVACLLAGASPFASRRLAWLAPAAALAAVALTAALMLRDETRLLVWFGGWEPRAGVALGVGFAVDGIGAGLALFVAVLGTAALALAIRVIPVQGLLFDALMLAFLGAMIGYCLTGDLFNLFVFFELMSVAAYVLVGYEVRRRAALEGALTFAVTNSVGSILLLFGIGLVYGRTGALNLAQIGRTLEAGPHDTLVAVAFALIACGLLVKAAVVPFHLWTADAYAVAPTPVCILLAGAFSELGLYGLARVYWTAFDGVLAAGDLRAVLIGAGVLTGVVGAVMCAVQHHLKRMLAFATIAHVGLFLAGLGLLSPDGVAGVAVWVVADGLVKAGLFACVAVVQHRFGTVEASELHGRARTLWPVGAVFVAGALTVASLPPFGSFVGKALVEDAAPGWIAVAMLLVTGLVGGTLLRTAGRIFWGLGVPAPPDPAGDEPEEHGRESEGGVGILGVGAGMLTLAGMACGLVPLRQIAGAAAAFTDRRGYAAAVLDGRALEVPALSLHGPGAAAYAYAAGSLALSLAVAAIGATRRVPVPRPVEALRRLHSGHPGDYVALTVAGAAVLVSLIALR